MLRILLRVFAVLLLLVGLLTTGIAGYMLLVPSDEEQLYEEKYKEMNVKYEQARAAKDAAEKARLLKEAQDAASSARVWSEGARQRRMWSQLGAGTGVVMCLAGVGLFLLTFLWRKKAGAVPA